MAFSLGGLDPIGSYLSITKNESKAVAAYAKSSPVIQRNATAFDSDIVDIKTPTDILSNGNYVARQVVLGAYNMDKQATQTALLRGLLTQDPNSSKSIVQETGSSDYLHFVRSLSNLSTVSLDFGVGAAQVFTTAGAGASSISVRNAQWGTLNAGISAASPAQSWTYVLDNGTAAHAVATALTTAWQSSGSTAAPVAGSYTADANGNIVASGGAPALTKTIDAAGNTNFTITLASNSSGAAIRTANVIAVSTSTATDGTAPAQISASQGAGLLAAALTTTGFNVASSSTGFTITNPTSNTTLSLATNSYSSFAAVTPQAISTSDRYLFLGNAGLALQPGQILLNQGQVIGTVQSVNKYGEVGLVANAAFSLAAGAEVDVAIGAGISNIGVQVTAQSGAGAGTNILALGSAGAAVAPGATIVDGGKVIGIVANVDGSGNVTFQDTLAAPVQAGDTLSILPRISGASIAGLSVASNAQNVLTQYETNAFESQQGSLVTGLDTALYFTRTMPTITTINELMSDPTLLKVVTNNLGITDSFSNLGFDQQVALMTKEVKIPDDMKPAQVQKAAEQYLAVANEQAQADAANSSISDLFGDNPNDGGDGPNLLSTLYPSSSSGDSSGLLSLFDNSSGSSGGISLSL